MSKKTRNLLWAKFKSLFSSMSAGGSVERIDGSLSNKLNINEEYDRAFRSRSYEEMWSQVQSHLRNTSMDGLDGVSSLSPHSISDGGDRISLSSLPFYVHLSDYLFEPQQQETLKEMICELKFHRLLIDYFEASLEACNICELLLRCIHQTRANYLRIKRVIQLSERVQDSADYTDTLCTKMHGELAAYALIKNPLTFVKPLQFREVHDSNEVLLQRLTSKRRKIRRRVKFNSICKKMGGYGLVISNTALAITLLVIVLHSAIGILAAPTLAGCAICLFRKKKKLDYGVLKRSLLERHHAQLDLAAKVTYIFINDFDTMSMLVKRLYDEIEHKKALAHMCVRNKKIELLKEIIREFSMQDSSYQEQLDELEQHTYLCFHTINRSRKLVLQEIMEAQQQRI